MRNHTTKLRRQSEINYFRERSSNANVSEFWKTFKPYLSGKGFSRNDNIILKENGTVITKPKEVCRTFMSYYENVADDIGSPDNFGEEITTDSIFKATDKHSNHPSIKKIEALFPLPDPFEFKEVTTNDVIKSLKRVNVKKSKGYDNISPFFLKIAAYELAGPITCIVNLCITKGIYPDVYKKNEVTPVYKAKDSFNKANYRPVSCSVSVSKIIEYQFTSQINSHFEKYFNEKLSAYRQGTGCEHVIINIVEDWKKALDNDKIVGSLLMDLSKAFDCLPHQLLIAKLKAYGFNLNACKLLASYLSNRKQRVKYYGVTSDWSLTKKGIPQGSVLGPLMYNVFVNDLLFDINESIYNYADDNTIAVIGNNMSDVLGRLESAATKCIDWFTINMMRANPEKFQLIILNKHNEVGNVKINVNGCSLQPVNAVKLLGIHINVKLDFSEHVDMLCKKASRNLKVLLKLSKKVQDEKDRFTLIESFVMSCFTYCPIVWHFCNKSLSTRMEKLYERGIRFASKDYCSSFIELLKRSDRSTFSLIRLKKILIFVYNCVNKVYADYLNEMYKLKNNEYSMRDHMIVNVPRFETIRFGKMSLKYSGAKLFNSVPVSFKESEGVIDLKRKLEIWKCHEISCTKCNDFIYH
jgi:hypothetical protein